MVKHEINLNIVKHQQTNFQSQAFLKRNNCLYHCDTDQCKYIYIYTYRYVYMQIPTRAYMCKEAKQPSQILRYASHIFGPQSGTPSASEMPNNHARGDPASPQSTHWSSNQVLRIPKLPPYFGWPFSFFSKISALTAFHCVSRHSSNTLRVLSCAQITCHCMVGGPKI